MPDRLPSREHAPTTPPHVLVVDDDAEVARLLVRYLGDHGMKVSVASDGASLRSPIGDSGIDAILLDLGLPDEDGLGLVRELRARWQGPLLIVSGRGESVDRVVGLELGADDYVAKPFDMRELLARIRSVLRRAQARPPPSPGREIEFAGMRLDLCSRSLIGRDGADIALTTGEFELLAALLHSPNQVLSRDQLMSITHGREAGPFDRAIDVQIGRLRRKIEPDPARPRIIKSVRSAGYQLTARVRFL